MKVSCMSKSWCECRNKSLSHTLSLPYMIISWISYVSNSWEFYGRYGLECSGIQWIDHLCISCIHSRNLIKYKYFWVGRFDNQKFGSFDFNMQIKKPTQLSLDVRLDFVEVRISILVFLGGSMIKRFSITCFWIRKPILTRQLPFSTSFYLLYICYKIIFNPEIICVYVYYLL